MNLNQIKSGDVIVPQRLQGFCGDVFEGRKRWGPYARECGARTPFVLVVNILLSKHAYECARM